MTTDFIGGDIGDRSTFSNSAQPNANSEQIPEAHNCGINDGDCRNTCGELPVTSENVSGFLEYLDFNDGSPSGDKMCKALEAVPLPDHYRYQEGVEHCRIIQHQQ